MTIVQSKNHRVASHEHVSFTHANSVGLYYDQEYSFRVIIYFDIKLFLAIEIIIF